MYPIPSMMDPHPSTNNPDYVLSSSHELTQNLTPFLDSSFSEAITKVGSFPIFVNFSKEELKKVFENFTPSQQLNSFLDETKDWGEQFSASIEGQIWTNYRFGIFNQNQPTHKKKRLIEGMNCKICKEYVDWARKNYPDVLKKYPDIDYLFQQLMTIEKLSHSIFVEKVKELSSLYPQINQLFYRYQGEERLAVTLRIIRFDKTGRFCLPLHHDISIFSLVFPSDDHPMEECLVIGPAESESYDLDKLKRPIRPQSNNVEISCPLLISGSLLTYMNIPIFPTPHAVLPHDREFRYVITACCHIPSLNTSTMNSVLNDFSYIPQEFKEKFILKK